MDTLTRNALSLAARFLEGDTRARANLVAAGMLHEHEAAALTRLEVNLIAAGEIDLWFRVGGVHGVVRGDVAGMVLEGICIRDDVGMGMVAQVLPGLSVARRYLLAEALERWRRGNPGRVVRRAVSVLEAVEG